MSETTLRLAEINYKIQNQVEKCKTSNGPKGPKRKNKKTKFKQ